ncbi:hypothetical protein M405DRAFT_803753 [Rhizopogon salebrosus TDB-379]|nr:hypothetical protein M405DRAFT_803753 [Rhizopogon salebrosus TDB-379]
MIIELVLEEDMRVRPCSMHVEHTSLNDDLMSEDAIQPEEVLEPGQNLPTHSSRDTTHSHCRPRCLMMDHRSLTPQHQSSQTNQ